MGQKCSAFGCTTDYVNDPYDWSVLAISVLSHFANTFSKAFAQKESENLIEHEKVKAIKRKMLES